jgi:hypothetical protein
MLRKALILSSLLLPFHNATAGAIDFRVGPDMAEISYYGQNATFGYGGADLGAGLLFNGDDDVIANGSILVSGTANGDLKALHFGVGAKVYAGNISGSKSKSYNAQGGSIAIGGQIRYVFPGDMPLAILGEAFIAPGVTNFSDWNQTQEYRTDLELEVSPSARAYVGYRRLEIEIDRPGKNNDYKVDNSVHIGVRFEF